MSKDRLRIIQEDEKENENPAPIPHRMKTTREEVQATFETSWKKDPSQFDPLSHCMGRERLARTKALLAGHCQTNSKTAVDLGCGKGDFSRMLREIGFRVTAVDIAKNALDAFRQEDADEIVLSQDLVPHTKLADGAFDLVVSTDLIGYLSKREHRLYFSELARLCKKEGFILCSTPIDYNSEDALDIFKELAETELEILAWKPSYHKYYLKLLDFFHAPEKFSRARFHHHYREQALSKRAYFLKYWFQLNSLPLIGDFWNFFRRLSSPLHESLRQSKGLLLFLESLCRMLSSDAGITHAILIAKRRLLIVPDLTEHPPIEMKQKQRIWE